MNTDIWSWQSMKTYLALTTCFIKWQHCKCNRLYLKARGLQNRIMQNICFLVKINLFSVYIHKGCFHQVVGDSAANIMNVLNDGGSFSTWVTSYCGKQLEKQKWVAIRWQIFETSFTNLITEPNTNLRQWKLNKDKTYASAHLDHRSRNMLYRQVFLVLEKFLLHTITA